MQSPKATVSKGFPAVRNSLPGDMTDRKANYSGSLRSKNSSFLENRDSNMGVSQSTANKTRSRTFGFRNHSHALGSTIRHFQTISDFPEIQSPRGGSTNNKDYAKMASKRVPDVMEALKSDPRAMEIFMDELALADRNQPKHMQFLANLPHTAFNSAKKGQSGKKLLGMREDSMQFEQTLNFTLQRATNMFGEMFGSS